MKGTVIVDGTCPHCGKPGKLTVWVESVRASASDAHVKGLVESVSHGGRICRG